MNWKRLALPMLLGLVVLIPTAMAASYNVRANVASYDRVAVGMCSLRATTYGPSGQTVFVGATARKPDGTEYDFEAQEVRLQDSGSSVQFNSMIGLGYNQYVVSVWQRKVPCDRRRSSRPGCQRYGYLLDGQLASTGWRDM